MKKLIGLLLFSFLLPLGNAKDKSVSMDSIKTILLQKRQAFVNMDSLTNVLSVSYQDTAIINLYNIMSHNLKRSQLENAGLYAQKAYELSLKYNYPFGQIQALLSIGIVHSNKGEFEKAVALIRQAITICQQEQGALFKKMLANCYLSMGNYYDNTGQPDSAISFTFQAYDIYKVQGLKKGMAYALNNIGSINNKMKRHDEALKYYEEALQIKREINNIEDIVNSLNGLSTIYRGTKKYDKALEVLVEAASLCEQTNNIEGKATVFYNRAGVYYYQNSLDSALKYFQASVDIQSQMEDKAGMVRGYNGLAAVYQGQNNFELAHQYYLKTLEISNEINFKGIEIDTYGLISENYYIQKKYKEAMEYFMHYKEKSDALINEKRNKEIDRLQEKFQTEKKEQQIVLQAAQNKIQKTIINSISGVLLLSFIATLVFWKQRQKLKKSNTTILNQQKELRNQNELILEEKNQKEAILKEATHMVNNGFHNISFLSLNREQYKTMDAFKEAVMQTEIRFEGITKLWKYYVNSGARNVRYSSNGNEKKGITTLFTENLTSICEVHNFNLEHIKLRIDSSIKYNKEISRIFMMSIELVTNSIKHAFDNSGTIPEITIELKESDLYYHFDYNDNGKGYLIPSLEELESGHTTSMGMGTIRDFLEQSHVSSEELPNFENNHLKIRIEKSRDY